MLGDSFLSKIISIDQILYPVCCHSRHPMPRRQPRLITRHHTRSSWVQEFQEVIRLAKHSENIIKITYLSDSTNILSNNIFRNLGNSLQWVFKSLSTNQLNSAANLKKPKLKQQQHSVVSRRGGGQRLCFCVKYHESRQFVIENNNNLINIGLYTVRL